MPIRKPHYHILQMPTSALCRFRLKTRGGIRYVNTSIIVCCRCNLDVVVLHRISLFSKQKLLIRQGQRKKGGAESRQKHGEKRGKVIRRSCSRSEAFCYSPFPNKIIAHMQQLERERPIFSLPLLCVLYMEQLNFVQQ